MGSYRKYKNLKHLTRQAKVFCRHILIDEKTYSNNKIKEYLTTQNKI